VKELMNEANLQQNVIMQMIGQRPQTAPSPMSELVASGTASGVPSDAALSRLSQNMGAQKLVTYQRITVGLNPATSGSIGPSRHRSSQGR